MSDETRTRLGAGDAAPDFTLRDQDDQEVSLAQLRGRRVILYFYPKDMTPGCTTEACQFNDAMSGFETAGVEVLGVSADDADSHRRFRAAHGLRFRLLTDLDHEVARRYGAYGERVLYGKRVTGPLRSTFLIGPGGSIERAWYGVRAEGHAGRVLDALG